MMKTVEPQRRPATSQQPIRKSFLILTAMIGLGAIALVMATLRHGRVEDHSANSAVTDGGASESSETSGAVPDPVASPSVLPTVAAVAEADPSSKARQLVRALNQVNLQPGQLTPEKAEKWHRDLEALIQQGTAAVPVLQEFLQRNEDVRFDSGPDANLLGEPTLRIALLKVLFDLPTPENVRLEEDVLRSTPDPDEIALLARQLRLQEPAKHRELIIQTVRMALARERNGQLLGRDTSALAEVLEYYGVPAVE